MRHLIDHRKLGRTSPHRKMLLRNLAIALLQHGRIETTLPKAKELQRFADRLVTWGKRNTVTARRKVRAFIHDQSAMTKLFAEIAPTLANRNGGYTRVLKMGSRQGDQAPMALIEYLDYPFAVKKAVAPKLAAKKEEAKVSKKKTLKTTKKN